MIFPSITFLALFFPMILLIFYAFSFTKTIQKIWIVFVSCVFYTWGQPDDALIFFGILIINIFLGERITASINTNHKLKARGYFIISIILNVGALVFMRYISFIQENLNMIIQNQAIDIGEQTLPVGMLFFSLRAISFCADCYTKKVGKRSLIDSFFYLSFFPFLLAGPLISYQDLNGSKSELYFDGRRFSVGMCRFTVGLSKKVLIADNLAIVSNRIFDLSMIGDISYEIPVLLAWLGLIAFAMQIYFDLSAYSDMAIGIALCLGYKCPENVDYPYLAKSVTEFWNRFHISLMKWFDQYFLRPLDRNNGTNKDRMVLNIFIMWCVIGLWHGPNWTFVFWGIWNSVFILLEKLKMIHWDKDRSIFKSIYVCAVILVGWVLFRTTDLYQAGEYFKNLLGLNHNAIYNDLVTVFLKEFGLVLVIGLIFLFPIARVFNNWQINHPESLIVKMNTIVYPIVLIGLFLVCTIYLFFTNAQPFIYLIL